ncbi:ExbD/TolR family protein [Piscinibacter sp.]|uniref:ExbD/TolR family protein n=1 Tax=Piscinibacter sp. TaxID=1903157 RepID=UPI002C562278|nr:ExbD/TolR family protein [Albitalea sp.]HUG23090.1 ExbD/TolR family protein [Albitalea sp.]
MPAVSHRGSGRRRTMSEINMVPFIDVMLVLLIIFMISAPLITTGLVDLPTVGKSKQRPEHVIEVVVGKDESVRVRLDGSDPQGVPLRSVATKVRELQQGNADTPVVISADKTVRYEAVVKVMDLLQKAGVLRVGLSVQSGA